MNRRSPTRFARPAGMAHPLAPERWIAAAIAQPATAMKTGAVKPRAFQ